MVGHSIPCFFILFIFICLHTICLFFLEAQESIEVHEKQNLIFFLISFGRTTHYTTYCDEKFTVARKFQHGLFE